MNQPSIPTKLLEYGEQFSRLLSELPGWDQLSRLEQLFINAYAVTGSKAEACRFINRSKHWCHDRRVRTPQFMDLITPGPTGNENTVLEMKGILLSEAMARVELASVLELRNVILSRVNGKRGGITAAGKIRAIKQLHKIAGLGE